MTPLQTLLAAIAIFMGMLLLILLGAMLGSRGSTKPRRPSMTMLVTDCSEMKYGLPPVDRWIKYHPSTGFYSAKTPDPTEHGKIRVMEKSGAFGRRKDWWTWDEDDLLIIGTGKLARGIYKPQHLGIISEGYVARLNHRNKLQAITVAELSRENVELSRGKREQVIEETDNVVKQVQRITPSMGPRKPATQQGR